MKKIIILFTIAMSASAFAASPVMKTGKCGSASVEVEAYVWSDALDVVSVEVDSVEVEYLSSKLQANLVGGTVYEISYCPAGTSMKDTQETSDGGMIIGCDIQKSLVICD